ncbi:uncharacterized protein LOC130920613 isoform X2 [Corythoichthys intestinalis]|uniref:uncharacterized protein LOC130920613 isoform X2 n=1 Tax=Corythoichthys intestinalis TaxID=161448 RepID=UPI0025A4E364|nr:uncharacterized protein LOC130920613 isoform X2 [Corythoichthys intestinalis]
MTEASAMIQDNLNDDSSDQPELPSPKKRKMPCEKFSSTDAADVLKQQDAGDNKVASPAALQSSDSTLQLSVVISVQNQAEAHSSFTKLDVTPDKNVEESIVNKIVDEQQEATVTHPISDSQIKRPPVRDENNSGKEEEEEKMTKECDSTLSQTCTDQHQVTPLTFEEVGSTALEDQQKTKDYLQCDLERNQNMYQDALSTDEDKAKQEDKAAVVGEITKKRKRMGMYGLTEKERSHILQTNKGVNGQGIEEFEPQISIHKVDSEASLSPPSMLQTPVPSNAEAKQEEILLSSLDNTDRQETKVQISATLSDVSETVCKPICHTTMEEEDNLEKPYPKDVDCGSSSLTPGDLEVQCVVITIDEKMYRDDAVDCDEDRAGASSANTQQQDDAVKLCEAAPSTGLEGMDMAGHDDGLHLCAMNTEQSHPMNSTDLLGSGCFDVLSDSQLNNITLLEDQAIKEKAVNPSGCEDASVLMCGLIKELSFLNRTVMAAHREIENMRRASKNSRNLPR